MPRHFKDWRDKLEAIDAELIRLINRRTELAIELLRLLRSQDSSGDLAGDADRLLVLLYPAEMEIPRLLSESAVKKLQRRVSVECRQIAEREIEISERRRQANSHDNAEDE